MPDFRDITKTIDQAVARFDKSIPGLQSELYKEMLAQIKRLDLNGTKIKTTVKNLSILASIKNKLNRLILNKDYISEVKEFAKTFNEVFRLQNDYWKSVESQFKPKPLLKAIRNQAITDTVQSLTQSGISANISDALTGILRQNITAGGSYADLAGQLRESLMNTETKGLLDRYTKQVTTDSINQFNRQYTQIVSSDLGYEWYRYMNSEIDTSRPFCQAMVENNPYFHVSQIPELLDGKYLGQRMTYTDNFGEGNKNVEIYKKTGLPGGMISGTNADNFFIRAGGWNCGHSIQPVAERQVPKDIRGKIEATIEYKNFISAKS